MVMSIYLRPIKRIRVVDSECRDDGVRIKKANLLKGRLAQLVQSITLTA